MFSWFLIPYLSDPITSVELGRERQLLRAVFDVVSDNDPMKIILLDRDKFTYTQTVPPDSIRSTFHYASLAALVGIGFSIFFIKKPDWKMYRILLMFSAGFIICTLLSLGSNGPLGDLYYAIVSQSSLGWIIRSPLKFQLYQLFFIVSLFTFSITFITKKLQKHDLTSVEGIIIIFIFVGSSAYGIYDANTFTFKPIELPSEYFEINNMLKDTGTEFKVLYYPIYPTRTTPWSEGHQIGNFETKSSAVPTYEILRNYNYAKETLFDYPYNNGTLSSPGFYDFLASVGVKYIVFNNDRNSGDDDEENLQRLSRSDDVKQIYAKNGWYLFEILREHSRTLSVANSLVITSKQSDIYNLASPDLPVVLNSVKQATSPSNDNSDTIGEAALIRISNNNQPVQLEYKRESATKVSAELNASSGSMLVFAETFDNGWKAYMNGQKVDSVRLNGMINGFPINIDGKIHVSIEYERQKWVEVGVIIATVYTVSFVIVTLLRKHITQRISALMNNIRSS
jgi:hypothetical protein